MANPTRQERRRMYNQLQTAQRTVDEIARSRNATPLPPVNSISASNLGVRPYSPPPQSTPTGYYGVNGMIKATTQSIVDRQLANQKFEEDAAATYDSLSGQGKRRNDLYKSEGVIKAKEELDAFTQRMRAKEQAYIARVDRVRNENPTGVLESGQNIELDRISKNHAIESSADAITAEFKLGNYENAKSLVDSLVDAETEDLRLKLEGIKYFGEKNADRLNQEERDILAQEEKQADREYQEKRDLRNDIGNIMLKAAEAGAPASVISEIAKSGDIASAIGIASSYVGSSGTGSFTTNQINDGAVKAGVDIATFRGFDADTKNFFINGDINGAQKSIDEAFEQDGASLDDVKAEINQMGLPAKGAEYLVSYAEKSAKKNGALTPEEIAKTLVGSLNDLKTSGYTRGEAADAVQNQLTDNGKTPLTKSLKNSMEDALVQVYGRTFWQRVLPYGR